MRRPCDICEEEAGHPIDKRRAECKNCKMRIDFADYREGRVKTIPESIRHCMEEVPLPPKPNPYGDKRSIENPVRGHIRVKKDSKEVDDNPSPPPELPPIDSKICTRCGGDPKPLSEFNRHSNTKDGLMNICKKCQSEIRRARPAVKTGRYVIKIDFSEHQDIYRKLVEEAKIDLRDTDMQALHIIIKNLC
jgi:hypothetical protein